MTANHQVATPADWKWGEDCVVVPAIKVADLEAGYSGQSFKFTTHKRPQYENIFINQLKIHYKEGDCLIVISASGNSPNVLKAVEWVRSKGGKIIGFLGFTGGELLSLCDVSIHIKTKPGEYGPVEDAHLIMNHILAHWFQNKLK